MALPWTTDDAPASPPASVPPAGYYRWVICALLFFATTINYVDRHVIAVLEPGQLSPAFGWTKSDYATVVFFFQLAYALGYALAGRMMDRIGVRKGFALVVIGWSAAAMAHGAMILVPKEAVWRFGLPSWLAAETATISVLLSVAGFAAARSVLGLAEGGNFPASIKTVGDWFPKQQRALATGIFNGGSNVGIIVTALVVPWVTLLWGWPAAFYLTGALGFVWVVFWLAICDSPQRHPRVSAAELAYIRSDPPDPAVHIPWLKLLGHRQTWAYTVGMVFSAPVWWFYLYWVPGFLFDKHGIDLKNIGLPLITIYLIADAGSIAGGWLSSALLKRGKTVNFARKATLVVCGLCAVPVVAASSVTHVWSAVLLIGLAAAGHAGFAANLYTLVSDTVPRKAVSSVVGIGGMAGSITGMFSAKLVGWILDWTIGTSGEPNYLIPFVVAGCAYLVATAIIHVLLPRMEVMEFEESQLTGRHGV